MTEPKQKSGWGSRMARLWVGPVPGWRMRAFEVLFTLQFLIWMVTLYRHPFEWLGEDGFHVDLGELNRSYWQAWDKLPAWAVVMFGLALFGGCGLIFWGRRWKRLGLGMALGCAVYALYADTSSAYSISRLNVLVFGILVTAPGSVRGLNGEELRWAGAERLCQGLIIALYFLAGVAKVWHGDWLEHDDIIWSHMQGKYRTELAAWLVREMPMGFWVGLKWLALLFELGAPLWFGLRRLRPVGIVLGLGFHATIALCFWSIWPFALHCVAYYVLFVPDACNGYARDWSSKRRI